MSQDMYYCAGCKKTVPVKTVKQPPICCGKPMKKVSVDICLQPDQAEHARPMAEDEPCDDFRGG